MTSSLTKISTARRVERSRIWLEGQRLLDHGFTHKSGFALDWRTWGLKIHQTDDGDRHVAGTPHRPIIDITGKLVRETFGENPYVSVSFREGEILITPTKETKG